MVRAMVERKRDPLDTTIDSDVDAGTVPEAPSRVGRYEIKKPIGLGGSSVVYEAWDPEIGRGVALKLVHGRPGREDEVRRRALREARAMARLQHENVLQLYDFGEHQGSVFLAMELVSAQTLREWLDQGPHPWRATLMLFLQAGRGLAAVHEAGLVHRDFKPDNVLVTREGRALIVDFGLVRVIDPASESLRRGVLLYEPDIELTDEDAVLGTPAYMAPEQFRGEKADPRSDQFAFCASLFEGLYGSRPFQGDDFATIEREVLSGRVGEPKTPGEVPTHVHAALLRGLSPDRDARFSAMEEAIAALAIDPSEPPRGHRF
jgi:serine/threonine protein kinase